MRKDRMMKILLLFTVGLISTCIYAAEEVSQQAMPFKGILSTKVHLGQMVKKGQTLFSLEIAPLIIQEDIDKNNLFYSDLIYKRDISLHQQNALSFMDLWAAKTAYLKAFAKLQAQKLKIERDTDKAPFDGEVTKIVNYTGSGIGDSNEIMDVTKTDQQKAIPGPVVAQVDDRFEHPIVMNVKLGQKVKKGQLLFSTSVKQFKITLERDKAQLEVDKTTFQQIKKAYKTHAISYDDYEEARVTYDNAIDAVKADLENIKQSTYYSPVDGTVTKIIVYTGSTEGGGDEIVDVTKLDGNPK